jgi:hypothetical protein
MRDKCEVCGQFNKVYTIDPKTRIGEWKCAQHPFRAVNQQQEEVKKVINDDKTGSRRRRIQFANFADLRRLNETPEADRLYVDTILLCPQTKIAQSSEA